MDAEINILSQQAQRALLWELLALLVERYPNWPAAHLLVFVNIAIHDEAGDAIGVTELANTTRLPKSTISRYVSEGMTAGRLGESIDPKDRRRRLITLKSKGRREWRWLRKELNEALRELGNADRGALGSDNAQWLIDWTSRTKRPSND